MRDHDPIQTGPLDTHMGHPPLPMPPGAMDAFASGFKRGLRVRRERDLAIERAVVDLFNPFIPVQFRITVGDVRRVIAKVDESIGGGDAQVVPDVPVVTSLGGDASQQAPTADRQGTAYVGAGAEPPSDLPPRIAPQDWKALCEIQMDLLAIEKRECERRVREEQQRAAVLLQAFAAYPADDGLLCWCDADFSGDEHSMNCQAARAYIAEADAQRGKGEK